MTIIRKNIRGDVLKQFVLIAVAIAIGSLTHAATGIEILYDFEDQTSRTNVVDVLTADGSQNGQIAQTSGNGPGNGPTYGFSDGVNGSGGLDFIDLDPQFGFSNMVETQGVIDFTTAMVFSVDINPNVQAAAGTLMPLLWTGKNRGTGETSFGINDNGQLEFYMSGLNPGTTHVSSGTNLIQLNQYQSVGFTLDLAMNTLTFFLNGAPIDTIAGVGVGQATLPANGHAAGSPVQVGWLQNISPASQTQYSGLMDNVYISDTLPDGNLCVNAPFYFAADQDHDCYVTLTDFGLYLNQWLWCTDTGNSACDPYQPAPQYLDSDFNQDYYVGGKDFSTFADQWQACTNPVDPVCEPYLPQPPPKPNHLGGWFTGYHKLVFNDEIVWPLGISGHGTFSTPPYYTPGSGILNKHSGIVVGVGFGAVLTSAEKNGLEQWVSDGGILIITANEGPAMWASPPSWLGFTSWWSGGGTFFRITDPGDPLVAGVTAGEAATLYSTKGVTGLLPGCVSVMNNGGSVSFLTYSPHGDGYVVYLGDFMIPRANPAVLEKTIAQDMWRAAIEIWANMVSHLGLPTRNGEIQKWWDSQLPPNPPLAFWWRYEKENPLGGALYAPPYPRAGDELSSLDFEMGKGERSWKYFFVTTSMALSTLEVRPTDLTGPGGSIPSSELSISIQEKPWPTYPKAPYWLVDPCNVEPLGGPEVNLAANDTYTYWLKVRCPEDTPAGTYQGNLEFINNAAVVETLPVVVTVWPIYQPNSDVLHYELEHNWFVMPGGYYIGLGPYPQNSDPDLVAEYMTHLTEMGVDFAQNIGELDKGYADSFLPPYTRIKETGVRLTDWLAANPNAFNDPYDPASLPHIDFSCYDAMYFDNAIAAGFTNFATNYSKPPMSLTDERKLAWRFTEYATYLKERGFPEVYTKIDDEFGPAGVPAFIDTSTFIRPTGFKTYTTTPNFQYSPTSVPAIDPHLDMWQWWPIIDWDQIQIDQGIAWDSSNELWAYSASSYWGNYSDYARGTGWNIAYGEFEGLHTHGYARWRWNDHEGVLPAWNLDYSPNDTVTVINNSQSVYQARYLAGLRRLIDYANQKGLAPATVAFVESELPNIIGTGAGATIRINLSVSSVAANYGPNARDIFPEYLVSPKDFETAKVEIFTLIQQLQTAIAASAQPSLKYGECLLVDDGTQRFQIVRDAGHAAQATILSDEVVRLTGLTPDVTSGPFNASYPVHVFLGTFGATTAVQNIVAADVPDHITAFYPAAGAYAIKHIPSSSYTGGQVLMVVGGDGPGLDKGVNALNNFLVPDVNRP